MSLPRVSPPRVSGGATRAGRPPNDAAGSVDASRQASFVLGPELDTIVGGLNLEANAATAATASRHRNHRLIAALGLWSRSWLARLDALHSVEWGSYGAAITLIRSAADLLASELDLLLHDAREWLEWLESGAIALASQEHATQYRRHPFRSAEILAGEPALGRIYRAATELSLPHFESTLMLVASDSTPERLLVTFGDRDFHLGLAELTLGWLCDLGRIQVHAIQAFSAVFPPLDEGTATAWQARALGVVDTPDRCRIEELDVQGERRLLVHNWRRRPGSARHRLLL